MKTKTNRLLSLLLTLTMVLGMLPAMSLTAFAAEPGISITGSTADSSGTGWSYVESTKTLTLSAYNGGHTPGDGIEKDMENRLSKGGNLYETKNK